MSDLMYSEFFVQCNTGFIGKETPPMAVSSAAAWSH